MDSLYLIAILVVGIILGAITGGIIVYFFTRGGTQDIQAIREKLIREYEQKIRDIQEQNSQNEGSLKIALIQEYENKIRDLTEKQSLEIELARKQSVDQSRSTLKGKMAEQMAPLLPGFAFLPADARFLGDPIDYVIFHGYTDTRDNGANPDSIELIILDIKQGGATLSKSQRAIASAIENGRVRFDIIRIFDNGEIKSHTWQSKTKKKTIENNSE